MGQEKNIMNLKIITKFTNKRKQLINVVIVLCMLKEKITYVKTSLRNMISLEGWNCFYDKLIEVKCLGFTNSWQKEHPKNFGGYYKIVLPTKIWEIFDQQ